jgi:hypothetical protein
MKNPIERAIAQYQAKKENLMADAQRLGKEVSIAAEEVAKARNLHGDALLEFEGCCTEIKVIDGIIDYLKQGETVFAQ